MRRRMAVRVLLAPSCISSRAAAQEASAWMEELVRTGVLEPGDGVFITDPGGKRTKCDVGQLAAGELEARAAVSRVGRRARGTRIRA